MERMTRTPVALHDTTAPVRRPAPTVSLPVEVGTGPLSMDEVVAVARYDAPVVVTDEAAASITASRAVIEGLADDIEPHYGVSTGFGALATRHIPPERRAQLQRGLVRSHAAGSGPEVEREVVRALMLGRLSTLATGRTGIRLETAQVYAAMLNTGITPVVQEYGSLGCSGDLAPLAHCALAAMGEGAVRNRDGDLVPAAEALQENGIEPVELAEKEGLALINGTDGMLGMLILAIADLRRLLTTADLTAAMSVEGLLGTDSVFAADLHALRPQPGQAVSAANIRTIMRDSQIRDSHRHRRRPPRPGRLLAALRPTGHRCSSRHRRPRRARRHLGARLGGRQPGRHPRRPSRVQRQLPRCPGGLRPGLPGDRRGRRGEHVRAPHRPVPRPARSHGLPPFLADDPGVDSGHMIAQYTQAAIVSELKRLANPASVDSIPSSAMQEDHVSMGWSAARKLRRSIDGLTRVLAIELLTAARGLELRAPLEPAPATAAVVRALREHVQGPGPDRFLSPEIEEAVEFVASGRAVAAAETVTGLLA